MTIGAEVVRVHVDNTNDFRTTATEEHEPEHFVFSTVIVAFNLSGYNSYELVLSEDPLRKDASVLAIDQPVVICHSPAQLTNPANQVSGIPYPQGAYLPAGASVTVTGTGRMWVVATTNQPSRVSTFINRRDRI